MNRNSLCGRREKASTKLIAGSSNTDDLQEKEKKTDKTAACQVHRSAEPA